MISFPSALDQNCVCRRRARREAGGARREAGGARKQTRWRWTSCRGKAKRKSFPEWKASTISTKTTTTSTSLTETPRGRKIRCFVVKIDSEDLVEVFSSKMTIVLHNSSPKFKCSRHGLVLCS